MLPVACLPQCLRQYPYVLKVESIHSVSVRLKWLLKDIVAYICRMKMRRQRITRFLIQLPRIRSLVLRDLKNNSILPSPLRILRKRHWYVRWKNLALVAPVPMRLPLRLLLQGAMSSRKIRTCMYPKSARL